MSHSAIHTQALITPKTSVVLKVKTGTNDKQNGSRRLGVKKIFPGNVLSLERTWKWVPSHPGQ